ncbi:hypothetical protein FQ085_06460 [Planococcus sp. ANT_H30]|uniref:recombinase family protein n=1 Tax=Planococcus sp. ANT_H30 TaxID=2597347 RepID=UPI0011ED957C|nr:recombinase family protein [Planococcus sp. ANT_H30]KAA0957688.1 hypothetical protein FQ085_06460 [Planococcus sp. ANT_H30]
MKKKAVLYTRISTNKLEQQKSLVNQEERYTEYCKTMGYELAEIYADEGLTGTNVRRVKFKEMLLDAGLSYTRNDLGYDFFTPAKNTKPKFDVIVCKDVSRFMRGSVQGQMVVKLLKDKGVDIIFENSGMSTFDEGYEFNLGILFQIAQNESANMSKRIKFAKQHNASKGKYSPARIAYGYTRNENNEIVIHEEQAEIVKHIFERYKEAGGSLISQELNEKGVLSQTGKRWTNDKVTRVIHNRIYTGTAIVGKSYKKNVTDTQRSKNNIDQYIEIPNAVKPIVTIEQYEEANLTREKRINKNKKIGRKPARNDIYNEKLFCSCGSRFIRHTGNGGKINYMCQKRRKRLGCGVRGISIQNLNRSLAEVELKYLSNAMGDSFYYKELLNLLAKQKLQLAQTKLDIQKQIDSLEEEIDKISDQFAFLNETDKMKARLVKKVDDRENQITELNQQFEKLNIESIEYILDKVEDKKSMIDFLSVSKSLIVEDKLKLLHRIEIGDYELSFQFAIPSFEEEVDLYNKLFPINPINLAIPFRPFTESFRRDHKAAREHWETAYEELK